MPSSFGGRGELLASRPDKLLQRRAGVRVKKIKRGMNRSINFYDGHLASTSNGEWAELFLLITDGARETQAWGRQLQTASD